MNQTFAIYILIALALVSANLPFFTERLFAVIPLKQVQQGGKKSIWLRLFELIVLYFVIGAVGRAFEAALGAVYPQGWEFYAITFTLFAVLAFPGYVWRYLMKR
ncbi:MAG: DUF2818 family protein [Pigmentiphaga sp.]|nr:DUF2818 family protein [Pigmentiphaga sp.]